MFRFSSLSLRYCLMMAASTYLMAMPVYAAETSAATEAKPALSRAALLGLARQFVDKVDSGFKAADKDILPRPGSALSNEEKIRRAFNAIPDGEILLLNLTLFNGTQRDTIYMKDPILVIKEGQDVLVSLTEFVNAANFPILVDSQQGKAGGWFIRENQIFALDVEAGTLQAGNQTLIIDDDQVRLENDDIMIKGALLAQIFDFTMVVNPGRQDMKIASAQKWPIEEKLDRDKRSRLSKNVLPPPRLPRLENDELKNISEPNVDVISTDKYDYQRGEKNDSPYSNRHTVKTAGDLLGHTAETYSTGTDEQRLSELRLTMSKNSEDADLLGPLKARSYSFVDVATTQVPFAGPAPFETGFQATNKDPFTTYNTMTTITGESIPGWDVELYRGQEYLMSAEVGDDGRYEFADVILFNGINNLRVVQYGARGEIREEDKTLSVGARTFNKDAGVYDVSFSFEDAQTYRAEPSDDRDRWQPHLAATYDYQVTDRLALRSGIQARQEESKDRVYLQTGAVETFGRTVLNQDMVMNNEGAYTGILTARHNIKRHNLFGSAKYESDNYNPNTDGNDPSLKEIDASVRGPLPNLIGERNQYSTNYNYKSYDDGNKERSMGGSYSAKIGKIVAQDTVTDRMTEGPTGAASVTTNNRFSLRGAALGLNWRAAVDYNIRPDHLVQAYNLELDKRYNDDLSAKFEVEHRPVEKYTVGELSASYRTPYAVFGPAISYDTNHKAQLSLRTSTALIYNPYDKDFKMVGKNLADKGGLSAFVYLDKNGNMVFDGDDEPVEGAVVQALHARKEAETNEKGEAYIYDLTAGLLSDVTVLEGSFFEPGWIMATPGKSIFPQKGHIARAEFPIHNSGEIDGIVYGQNDQGEKRVLKGIKLRLIDMEGHIVQKTVAANDGFYLFSKVPPGKYFIIPDPNELQTFHVSPIIPQPVAFNYDGGVLYGHNIVYPAESESGFGFDIVSSDTLQKAYPDAKIPVSEQVALNLGSYNSEIGMAVTWYRLQSRYHSIIGDLYTMFDEADFIPDAATGLYTLRLGLPSKDIREAFERCRALAARNIFCRIEHLPGTGITSVAANMPSKG